MTIHKEGIPSIILVFSIAIVLQFISALVFNNHPVANFFAWAIGIFLIVLMLQFFRKPSRKFNVDENILVSPCDGKVVVQMVTVISIMLLLLQRLQLKTTT